MYTPKWVPGPTLGGTVINDVHQEVRGDSNGSSYFVSWRWHKEMHIMYMPTWVPQPNIRGDSHKWCFQEVRGDSDGSSYENERIDQFVLWQWQLRVVHIMYPTNWVPRPNIRGDTHKWRLSRGQGDSDGSSYENERIDLFVWWWWQLRVVNIMYTPK